MAIKFEFEVRSIPEKKAPGAKPIPQDVIDQFKEKLEALEKGREGLVRLGDKKELSLARRAIQEAALQAKNWVKVRKERGSENVLLVQRVSKREYDEAQKKAAARGAKLRGKRKAKVAPKTKAKGKGEPKS
ncbi:MAG: hypothetical protein ABIH46_06505 [Chloroflexota bacterium]